MNLRKDHNRYCIAVCLHGEETLAVRACMCILYRTPSSSFRAREKQKRKKSTPTLDMWYRVPAASERGFKAFRPYSLFRVCSCLTKRPSRDPHRSQEPILKHFFSVPLIIGNFLLFFFFFLSPASPVKGREEGAGEREKTHEKLMKMTLNGGSLGSWIDEERSKVR